MMRLALSLAVALSLSAPVVAEPVAGHSPEDLAVQAMHFYAACIVNQTPQGAREALALDSNSPEYHKKLVRLADGHKDKCVGGNNMRFNDVLLAGALAERLVQLYDAPPRFVPMIASSKPIEAHNDMEVMAVCVTRAAPDKVWTLFATDPTSQAEIAALNAMSPTIVGCIKSGQKIALNKPGLRAVLAISAYRLGHEDSQKSANASMDMPQNARP
jgi:hypothetical protein